MFECSIQGTFFSRWKLSTVLSNKLMSAQQEIVGK